MSFLGELKRHNINKAVATYLILAWIPIQIASIIFPNLHLSLWVTFFVFIFLIIKSIKYFFPLFLWSFIFFILFSCNVAWANKDDHALFRETEDILVSEAKRSAENIQPIAGPC